MPRLSFAPLEEIITERQLSPSLYDEDGNIIIEDARIKPMTFQGIYLKEALPDLGPNVLTYMKLPYSTLRVVPISTEEDVIVEEDELETPLLVITEGMLVITDPDREFLTVPLESFFDGIDVKLVVLG